MCARVGSVVVTAILAGASTDIAVDSVGNFLAWLVVEHGKDTSTANRLLGVQLPASASLCPLKLHSTATRWTYLTKLVVKSASSKHALKLVHVVVLSIINSAE